MFTKKRMLADAAMLSMAYRKIGEDGEGPSLVPHPTRYRTKTGEKCEVKVCLVKGITNVFTLSNVTRGSDTGVRERAHLQITSR